MKIKKIISCVVCVCLIIFTATPSFAEVNTSNLKIESGACILVEPSTNKIIYEKNSKEKMYPASTTKIMTALLAIENCKLDDTIKVSRSAANSISADYATVYLDVGEVFTVEQLLNVLLVPSGNVVGVIFAEHISGSVEAFSKLMNKRAKELGCVNTNFTNPYGLHDENHYTCAYDLYLISKKAMEYDIFRSIVSKTSYKLDPTDVHKKDDRTYYTTNELIRPNSAKRADNYYYQYATGIKTGYTSQAKNCLVASASKDGLDFYCVILGAEKNSSGINLRYTEAKKLFDFAFNNYYLRTLKETNSVLEEIKIKNATKDTMDLDVLVKNKISVVVDKDNLYSIITPEIKYNKKLKAPISSGEKIGTVKYVINGITYESDLIASHDVYPSHILLIIVCVSVPIVLFVFIKTKSTLKKNRRKRKRKFKF